MMPKPSVAENQRGSFRWMALSVTPSLTLPQSKHVIAFALPEWHVISKSGRKLGGKSDVHRIIHTWKLMKEQCHLNPVFSFKSPIALDSCFWNAVCPSIVPPQRSTCRTFCRAFLRNTFVKSGHLMRQAPVTSGRVTPVSLINKTALWMFVLIHTMPCKP